MGRRRGISGIVENPVIPSVHCWVRLMLHVGAFQFLHENFKPEIQQINLYSALETVSLWRRTETGSKERLTVYGVLEMRLQGFIVCYIWISVVELKIVSELIILASCNVFCVRYELNLYVM
jgi:hypothetical protein